jgi:rubrerythrin
MLGFNADEIFRIGMEIELNGKAFYQAAVESCADKEAKGIFEYLRDEEAKHYDLFAKMRSNLPQGAKAQTVFDPDDEIALYIKALADSRVFTTEIEAARLAKSCKTPVEVLRVAQQFEKDTILLFESMKEVTKAEWGQAKIDDLIDEEKGHIRKISAILAKILKNN